MRTIGVSDVTRRNYETTPVSRSAVSSSSSDWTTTARSHVAEWRDRSGQLDGQPFETDSPQRRTTKASTPTQPPPTTLIVILWVAMEGHDRW